MLGETIQYLLQNVLYNVSLLLYSFLFQFLTNPWENTNTRDASEIKIELMDLMQLKILGVVKLLKTEIDAGIDVFKSTLGGLWLARFGNVDFDFKKNSWWFRVPEFAELTFSWNRHSGPDFFPLFLFTSSFNIVSSYRFYSNDPPPNFLCFISRAVQDTLHNH